MFISGTTNGLILVIFIEFYMKCSLVLMEVQRKGSSGEKCVFYVYIYYLLWYGVPYHGYFGDFIVQ